MLCTQLRKALLLAACGALGCSFASAQVVPLDPPKVEAAVLVGQLVKDLASDDIDARMEAQRQLSESTTIRLKDLEAPLKDGKLSPEQHRRLLAVAYARFCTEPRAALGIRSDQFDTSQRGVLITQVMPGFPASGILKGGDRLLSIDGRVIDEMQAMRPAIVAHDPGDEVVLAVLREAVTINVKARLGRFLDLDERGMRQPLGTDLLEDAWLIRCESYGNAQVEQPLEAGIPAESWLIEGTMDVDDGGDPAVDARVRINTRNRLSDSEPGTAAIVAGGEARGAGPQVRLSGPTGLTPNVRFAPNNADARVPADARAGMIDRARRDAVLRQQKEALTAKLLENAARIPNAPAEERRRLNSENVTIQAELLKIDALLQQPQILKP